MNNIFTQVIVLFVIIAAISAVFIAIGSPTATSSTEPQRIASYDEVVPRGFSAPDTARVYDMRNVDRIVPPRLGIVRIADGIVEVGCPDKLPECVATAFNEWTRASITHRDALLNRRHILSPEETILFREADDMSMSVLLASLLEAEGIDARIGYTPYVTFVEATIYNQSVRLDRYAGQTRYDGPDENIRWVYQK